MRIRMYLPRVEPDKYDMPPVCPYDECKGEYFKLHQRHCRRAVLDPEHHEVEVRRYRCLSCRRTFRVYPRGVSGAQRSDRLRGIGIMLYVLGLSYGAVQDALFPLGWAGRVNTEFLCPQITGLKCPLFTCPTSTRRPKADPRCVRTAAAACCKGGARYANRCATRN